jgi:hypothetical protein
VKIIASAQMLKRRLELKREGRLGEGMTIAARTPEERVRLARARLAIQGAPLMYKAASEPDNASAPTQEWRAKYNGYVAKTDKGRGEVKTLKQYRIRSFMDAHGDGFPPELQNAVARFLQDSEYHHRVKIADLNRSGGSGESRLGGLGNCPQHVRDGHARHVWLENQLATNRLFYHVLEKLLYRTQNRHDGKPFNLEDFGRLLWPALNDANALRYSTKTAVMAFGAELLKLYAHPACPRVRWISDDERMLELEHQR